MVKRDGYNFEEHWEAWKRNNSQQVEGVKEQDQKILIRFLQDMEQGINTPAGRKGRRNAGTLLNLATHNLFFLQNLPHILTKTTKEDLHKLEGEVVNGNIERKRGGNFGAFGNYIKDFKVLIHWMQRVNLIEEDITSDLSSKTPKPAWVYLSEEQIKTFFNSLLPDYQAICWFMYDSGARVTEANSIQIKHFSRNFEQVTIPEEAAKTFERTINLKLCSKLIQEFVKRHGLGAEDFLFQSDLFATNKYLKYHASKMFGDKVSHPKSKGKYSSFTLYDIRHNSACYWLQRYPKTTNLMYRMGWKDPDKVEYYTDFLGQKDKITDDDMILSEDKGIIERQAEKFEKEIDELKKTQEEKNKIIREASDEMEIQIKGFKEDNEKMKKWFAEIKKNYVLMPKAK